jgi:hypothetical protein
MRIRSNSVAISFLAGFAHYPTQTSNNVAKDLISNLYQMSNQQKQMTGTPPRPELPTTRKRLQTTRQITRKRQQTTKLTISIR